MALSESDRQSGPHRLMQVALRGGSAIGVVAAILCMTEVACAQVSQTSAPTDSRSGASPAPSGSDPQAQVVAQADAVRPSASATEYQGDEVIVTASRLNALGFTAATPTTVFGSEDIEAQAKPNIFDAIAQLPSLQGSTGISTGNGGTSNGRNGLSSFNLRGLGSSRTLTLLDGQRVVPANISGVPDISQFPQLLVRQVDIVTGGASASYGSDAVAGVINFITDTRFEGFKYNVQVGETTYGDGQGYTIQGAAGASLLGNRLHIQASAEFGHEDEIGPGGFGVNNGPSGRDWYRAPAMQTRTVAGTPAGAPQLTPILFAQDYQFAKYGLITAGPLQGTAFGEGGAVYQFDYGSSGVPSGAANGAVSNCINAFCEGGDLSGNVGNGASLRAESDRHVLYGRASFELTDHIELFGTANFARVRTEATPNPGAFKNANLTIQCSNPYVPASVQAACATNGITSFQFGTANAQFPENIRLQPTREQQRFVVGAQGDFNLFGKSWRWDTYYQNGVSDTDLQISNITLTPRYNAAIDAILLDGEIVCRNAAARASGCAPMNVLGNVAPSDAAWAYVAPESGPYQESHQKQEAFALTFSGSPLDGWAGPIPIAFGIEKRRESYSTTADPYGDGTSTISPNTAAYPADPLLNDSQGNNWYAGNFHRGSGEYDVTEGFVEIGVPLVDSEALGNADLQLAARHTDYSTSGKVNTWKVGLSYDLPFDGWRVRGVRSRDIRAPNLSELFAPAQVTNVTVLNPATGTSLTILNQAVGNTELRPEIGNTTEFGIVLSNPSWFRSFNASVDFYRIDVAGQIASPSAQQVVNLCFDGQQVYCPDVFLTGNAANPNRVTVRQFNLASVETQGIDFETSVRLPMGEDGTLTLRALATYVDKFVQNPGLPGQISRDLAGENTGEIPKWKALFIQNYESGRFSLNLTERFFSSGVKNNNYIECQFPDCPAPTTQNPTISNNQMDGAIYVDVGLNYEAADFASIYFRIDNLFNHDPDPVYANQPNNIGANASLYDTLGRYFRLGVRGEF